MGVLDFLNECYGYYLTISSDNFSIKGPLGCVLFHFNSNEVPTTFPSNSCSFFIVEYEGTFR